MAQESRDKRRAARAADEDEADEAPEGEGSSETSKPPADDEALVKADEGDADESEGDADESEGDADESEDAAGEGDVGEGEGDAGEEDGEQQAAAQLGADRYVLAGFFAAGMLGAYVIGRAVQSAWASVANKDWFNQGFPRLAAVSDDDKGMYGILLGGLIALVVVYRSYKKPDIRAWCDEVAAELAKVVWPSRKEVTNSTFIVIVASAAATLYLALLDRLWAFVTNIVYGDGS